MAQAKTVLKKRKLMGSSEWGEVTVDDALSSLLEFEHGAMGNFETSRFCPGRKNHQFFEINGSKGSIYFDLEEMNRLKVYLTQEAIPSVTGFHDVMVSVKIGTPHHDKSVTYAKSVELGGRNLIAPARRYAAFRMLA